MCTRVASVFGEVLAGHEVVGDIWLGADSIVAASAFRCCATQVYTALGDPWHRLQVMV